MGQIWTRASLKSTSQHTFLPLLCNPHLKALSTKYSRPLNSKVKQRNFKELSKPIMESVSCLLNWISALPVELVIPDIHEYSRLADTWIEEQSEARNRNFSYWIHMGMFFSVHKYPFSTLAHNMNGSRFLDVIYCSCSTSIIQLCYLPGLESVQFIQ